jgi:hypothetical protein
MEFSSSPDTQGASGETRCECGQLMAKVRDHGLELKCKRCKRVVLIPFSVIEGWYGVPPPLQEGV